MVKKCQVWFNKTLTPSLLGPLINKQVHTQPVEYSHSYITQRKAIKTGILKVSGAYSLDKKHSGNVSAVNYQRTTLHPSISLWWLT